MRITILLAVLLLTLMLSPCIAKPPPKKSKTSKQIVSKSNGKSSSKSSGKSSGKSVKSSKTRSPPGRLARPLLVQPSCTACVTITPPNDKTKLSINGKTCQDVINQYASFVKPFAPLPDATAFACEKFSTDEIKFCGGYKSELSTGELSTCMELQAQGAFLHMMKYLGVPTPEDPDDLTCSGVLHYNSCEVRVVEWGCV